MTQACLDKPSIHERSAISAKCNKACAMPVCALHMHMAKEFFIPYLFLNSDHLSVFQGEFEYKLSNAF